MFRQRFHSQNERVYIAYSDYHILATFDFRGCAAPSLQILESEIKKEVKYIMQIEGRDIDWDRTDVYFKNIAETRFPEGGINCDAIAVVKIDTMNRTPVTIGDVS